MYFLINFVSIILFLSLMLVILFSCLCALNCYYIKKIKNNIIKFSIEYDIFRIREVWAEKENLAFTEPFDVFLETKDYVLKSQLISQADYYKILQKLENEIELLLLSVDENILENPLLKTYILSFEEIKNDLYRTNP